MDLPETKLKGSNAVTYSVSDIALAVKQTVEAAFDRVQVRGEVSGYRGPHSSGHVYFSLKDEKARLEAVIWRGIFAKLRFKPEEGMEVLATGKLTTFPGSSKYQIVIDQLEPAGIGALMALLEERRKKLASEGLFAPERKKPLPYLPRIIGVVTSPTGAVIRDILHRLHDRCPVQVLIWPVRVQGETSAAEVTAAIEGFNRLDGALLPRPDLIIVARGGGSLEDLWSFNEENVIRAAAASSIPLISAIGHETDWTLLDHVADRRAPTPTGAAEMAVPVRHELEAAIANLALRASQALHRHLERQKAALKSASRALPGFDQLFALPRQRFDMTARRLPTALQTNTARHRTRFTATSGPMRIGMLAGRLSQGKMRLSEATSRLNNAFPSYVARQRQNFTAQAKQLHLVSYQSVLARGFVLARGAKGSPVRLAAQTKEGQNLWLEFSDGQVKTVVQAQKGGAAAQGSNPSRPPAKRQKPKGPDQGALF